MDLSETETMRPVLRSSTRELDGGPRLQETAPAPTAAKITAATRKGNLRVALVGAGYVAQFHRDILAETPGVSLVAVCDADAERARAAARQWGIPNAVGSVEELGDLAIDVAHVLVPPDLHVKVTRALLEMGIGVLVEKPMALASADARELQALADRLNLPLGVNHNNVWHPAFVRLLDHVRAGRIGRVEHVRVCLSVPLAQLEAGDFSHWMFRSPENIVFEQAPHPLSQLHALIGAVREARTTILGTRELHPGQIFHDRWLVAAEAERGTAEIYLAFGQGFNRWTLEVLGSDGSAEADLGHNLFSHEEKTPWLEFWNSFLAGWRRSRALSRGAAAGVVRYARFTLGMGPRMDSYFAGMRGSVQAFYGALRGGKPLPVDGAQAAEVLDWCEVIAGIAATAAEAPRGRTSVAAPAHLPEPGPARPDEVVVLGGTGFIGRRVVAKLVERGLPVTAVVRRAHSLPAVLTGAARDGRLRLVPGRLEDGEALATALKGAKTVLHLATGGGDSWEKIERSMIRGSVDVAEAALAAGAGRFVYVSSIAALYAGPDRGTSVIDDDLQTDPQPEGREIYSRGKMEAERRLLELHRQRGLPLVIVRPGVVLGEGTPLQHSGLGLWVRDNHCVGWGPGEHPLPVVDVDDVAEALVLLALYPGHDLDGQALNLCSRAPLSAREIVDEMRWATGRDLHFHPRPLWLSQTMEIGKWVVKKAGRRPGVTFPSYRDLKTRSLAVPFNSRLAREKLGWRPVEDREEFLDRAVRFHARP
ncbi:MAG TPA: NAD-dependent epimerase/dehydratase family protein [Thermoanaerobaculia bacterium]|nr:NAD-dependent epimerase/dehydratase family protein [Thermoanaerobaculia bacterium]